MPNLVDSSANWGWVKYTMLAESAAKQGGDIPCKSCQIYTYTGTGAFVGPTAETATTLAPALPTTFATAKYMPVDNVNKMWFVGTVNDVVMVVYRQ
jgi:hypothetical protein